MGIGEAKSFVSRYNGVSDVLINEVIVANPLQEGEGHGAKYGGIWDTGATNTCITQRVVDDLGISPIGRKQVQTAGGIKQASTYMINLILPNDVHFPALEVTLADLGTGSDLLIGMDVISCGDFAVTTYQGKTVFTYRHPSQQCIDFVAASNKVNTETGAKLERNDPCPCGSGRKFKKCCGA